MQRSTSLIVRGLLIAVAPVLAAALGAVLVQVYGRHPFGELLQWSLVLLIVSIPLGAAMVVAGGAAKAAGYRALREAGLANVTAAVRLRDWLPYSLLGAFMILAPAFLDMDVNGQPMTNSEAWRAGIPQFSIVLGIGLMSLAIFARRGASWVRWPIALWCPLTMFGGAFWALAQGVGRFDPIEFGVGLFIAGAWMWVHLRKM